VESYAFNALGALKTSAGVSLDDQRPRLAGGGTADAAVPATLGGSAVALDAAGRITSVKGISLGWTAAGKLASATPPVPGLRQDFEDDAYRRRVTMYRGGALADAYVNQGDHRIARLGPSGAVVESTLFDGIDHPLRLKRGGVSTFFELDLAGNVRRLRGAGGADLGGYRYSAFGKTLENTASVDQVLRWKGRPRDVIGDLEIYDMRARTWVPEMGVFLSVDAFAFHDARTTLWGWPGQNPVRYSDPSGHYYQPGPGDIVPLVGVVEAASNPLALMVLLGTADVAIAGAFGYNVAALAHEWDTDVLLGRHRPWERPGQCSVSGGGSGGGGGPPQRPEVGSDDPGADAGRYTERQLREAERALRTDDDFRRWFHREYKATEGHSQGDRRNPDLSREQIRDAYEEWRDYYRSRE
jgi:RHS repeat-associated protein